MSYSQERLESQQLIDYTNLGQDIAVNIALSLADTKHNQFLNDSNWTQISQTLSDEMKRLIAFRQQLDNSINASVKTETNIRRLISESENSDNTSVLMNTKIDEIFAKNLSEITAQNNSVVEENEKYKKLLDVLDEFGAEDNDNVANGGDEELQIEDSQQTHIPIDPFSKTEIEIPVKHKKCGHLFDREQLRRVLEAKGDRRQRCPYVGCGNKSITLADMVDDRKTKALIDKIKRNQN